MGRTNIDPRTISVFKKFQEYMINNVSRDSYRYIGIKPNTKIFTIVSKDKSQCVALREKLGYFFHKFELEYLVVDHEGNSDT
jgi:hypothetical protein